MTDWQEDSCILGLNTALTKWMEWCWFLPAWLGGTQSLAPCSKPGLSWFTFPRIFQPGSRSHPYPMGYCLGLPTSGLCLVITESCRLHSIFLTIPPYTILSVLNCVTPAVIIPKQSQEQNCAVTGGKNTTQSEEICIFPSISRNMHWIKFSQNLTNLP